MSRERRTIPLLPADAGVVCPLAPPDRASVQVRALHRACLVLGGMQPLAAHLGVADSDIGAWLRGERSIPEGIFHAAVEILLLHTGQPGRAN